ncbi:uncharacterized protein [Nicotiana tomentosiformis]|uniref:uncharacterized protein n=1 Tax=Nicotiana tomentosiformis TaxID=4098 RepID=UPI00388C6E56
MDSGCSKHMTGSRNQFLSLEDLKGGNVSFGNGKKGEIIGVGKVGKDDSHSIENVYLIDGLKYSLISVSQLCDRDNLVAFTFTKCFVINLITDKIVLQDSDPLLWHKRLGHASLSQLNKLVSKDLVIGLPNIKFKEDKVYEACARGKQEHDDEEIGLVKHLNETTAQTEESMEEGTGDGTGSSIPGNMAGEIEQNNSQTSVEPVPEPVPQQQNIEGTSRGNQLVVKPYRYQSSHPIENIITDPTYGIKTRYSLKNYCAFDAFLSLIEPKNVAEALQDADWIYVDDIIFGATTDKLSKEFAKLMGIKFEISMMDSKEIDTPIATTTKLDIDEPDLSVDQKLYRGMIDSLLYLTASRHDIVFSVGLCARFKANTKESHLTVVKRILRYLKVTTDLCLWYPKGSNFKLVGYADADYAGFLVDRKRTSGMAHFLGSCLVSWATKKQNSVALSTVEAEYIAAASCYAQLLWIKQQLMDFGIDVGCIPIFCDNTSAISMTKNPVNHKRTKHIDVKHINVDHCGILCY